jgi:ribulose 1,5-bisphosphate synthetase/thiazole synthase
MKNYRSYGLWLDDCPHGLASRPALGAPTEADVVIVGAGYTGLRMACYPAKSDPHLRVGVLGREIAGFGASGHDGGWVSPFFATQRAMHDTVDEVGRVVTPEGI